MRYRLRLDIGATCGIGASPACLVLMYPLKSIYCTTSHDRTMYSSSRISPLERVFSVQRSIVWTVCTKLVLLKYACGNIHSVCWQDLKCSQCNGFLVTTQVRQGPAHIVQCTGQRGRVISDGKREKTEKMVRQTSRCLGEI